MIDVQVWILGAIESSPGSGCYIPDGPFSPPDPPSALCGPTAVVTLDGTAGGLVDHSIPLPPCTCLANGQKAFVLIKIVAPGTCSVDPGSGALNSPAIVVDATPDPCVSYNAFPGSGGPLDMLGFGFPGNNVMWIEPECCPPTSSLPGSWSRLKTLYR